MSKEVGFGSHKFPLVSNGSIDFAPTVLVIRNWELYRNPYFHTAEFSHHA